MIKKNKICLTIQIIKRIILQLLYKIKYYIIIK